MGKTLFFLKLASIIMLFSLVSAAFAENNVSIQFNGGGAFNKVYLNETNILQIVIANDNNLAGSISLGFEFSWDAALTVVWDPSHSDDPAMWEYLRQENDAVGVWNVPSLSVTSLINNITPDSILIGGVNLFGTGLPANPFGRVCYSMAFDASGSEALGGFCVDNIFFPPGGGWIFNEGSGGFPPDFQGNPNSSTGNPDAPAVCFDVIERPTTYDVSIHLNSGDDILYIGESNLLEIWLANEENLAGAISLGFEFTWDPSISLSFDPAWSQATLWDYVHEENDAVGAWNVGHLQVPTAGMDDISPDQILIGGSNLGGSGLPSNPIGRMCYSLSIIVPDSQPEVVNGFSVDNIFLPPGGGWIFNLSTVGFPPTFNFYPSESTANPDAPPISFDIAYRVYEIGDADGSGAVDISDAVFLINYIFNSGPPPVSIDIGDADCSGAIDISDAVYLINFIFNGGPVPCE